VELLADIFFSYEVGINLFTHVVLFLLLSSAFYHSIFILINYKKVSSSAKQYLLEKKSYLVITIITVSLIVKTLLLPFFIYSLNQLSEIIPGAMCGAGVISSNSYGEPLIALKILIILITLLWLKLNLEDLKSRNFKYFKRKLLFFLLLYILILIEIILEIFFFTNLSTLHPVLCCSSIYDTKEITSLPFNLSISSIIIIFYTLYFLIISSAILKKRFTLALLSLGFIYISYFSIVYFFSTYIYELPSHKCPYCLLQPEYYYIGYFIYSSLLIATYYALSSFLFKTKEKTLRCSILWYSISLFFISFNFLFYLIINRTFL
jgi:hypothetical protein